MQIVQTLSHLSSYYGRYFKNDKVQLAYRLSLISLSFFAIAQIHNEVKKVNSLNLKNIVYITSNLILGLCVRVLLHVGFIIFFPVYISPTLIYGFYVAGRCYFHSLQAKDDRGNLLHKQFKWFHVRVHPDLPTIQNIYSIPRKKFTKNDLPSLLHEKNRKIYLERFIETIYFCFVCLFTVFPLTAPFHFAIDKKLIKWRNKYTNFLSGEISFLAQIIYKLQSCDWVHSEVLAQRF